MWPIYSKLLTACLTIFLVFVHKKLSERNVPVKELIPHKVKSDRNKPKVEA